MKRQEQSHPLRLVRLAGLGLGLVASATCLSGCAISTFSNPFKRDTAVNYNADTPPPVTEDAMLANAKTDTGSDISPTAGASQHCPQVVAWPQDRVITTYQSGHKGDSLAIIYRGELTKLARDCQLVGNRVTVRYGFAGRVLLGPKGHSGTYTLPVSIRVSNPDKKVISHSRLRVPAPVPSGNPVGYFSAVKTTSFSVATGTRPEDYQIFVALVQ